MSWREWLDRLPEAVAPGELAVAIGQLEVAKAQLYARLISDGNPCADSVEEHQSTEPRPDRLISVTEAARRLSVTERWLYEHADELPFTRRVGPRLVRFSESGVEKWIKQR